MEGGVKPMTDVGRDLRGAGATRRHTPLAANRLTFSSCCRRALFPLSLDLHSPAPPLPRSLGLPRCRATTLTVYRFCSWAVRCGASSAPPLPSRAQSTRCVCACVCVHVRCCSSCQVRRLSPLSHAGCRWVDGAKTAAYFCGQLYGSIPDTIRSSCLLRRLHVNIQSQPNSP